MATKRRKPARSNDGPHIFWRGGRAYADLRAYADVGGKKSPLNVKGATWGTTDPEVAKALFADRLSELETKRRTGAGAPVRKSTTLAELARDHLLMKGKAGETSESHMNDLDARLKAAVKHFGGSLDPRTIEPADVRAWGEALAAGGRKPGTVRHYLNALSGLYKRANESQVVDPGYNPVAALVEKPSGWSGRAESHFFEVHEAALLLEAARVVEKRDRVNATPGLYTIVATMLLTGGRWSEVIGLDIDDVSFDRGLIYFRPNEHRGLKTKTSKRDVPLWPQLREILQDWMFGGDAPRTEGLLFPASARTGGGMVQDLRKSLDEMGELCGMRAGEVRTKAFRHTYCSTRLQTVQGFLKPGYKPTDPDAVQYVEVSQDAVAREMGHGGSELVKRIYGHRARNPHRAFEVEYRAGQHREVLGERLRALEAATC
jgi:integrase